MFHLRQHANISGYVPLVAMGGLPGLFGSNAEFDAKGWPVLKPIFEAEFDKRGIKLLGIYRLPAAGRVGRQGRAGAEGAGRPQGQDPAHRQSRAGRDLAVLGPWPTCWKRDFALVVVPRHHRWPLLQVCLCQSVTDFSRNEQW